MLYLFHGPDRVALREALARLCERVASDPALRDLNITRLDGAAVSAGELSTAASTWPFLAERRLVIVDGLSRQFEPRGGKPDGGEAGAPAAPEGQREGLGLLVAEPESPAGPAPAADHSTRIAAFGGCLRAVQSQTAAAPEKGGLPCDLVLVEAEPSEGGERRRGSSRRRQGGLAVVSQMVAEAHGMERNFAAPALRDLVPWIRARAEAARVVLEEDAVKLLAETIGPQTDLLDVELEKLRTYSDGRPVSARDVRILVAEARAANVFELGDSVALGDPSRALALLEHLAREGESPFMVLQLLVRHFRQLLEARDAAGPEDLARRARMPPWLAEKVWRQASRSPLGRLRAALEVLLAADAAVKQGRCEEGAALHLAVLHLSSPRSAVGRHLPFSHV